MAGWGERKVEQLRERGARGISIAFFFNDTATTEIYTLSLHDALPISHPAIAQARMIGRVLRIPRFQHVVELGLIAPDQEIGRAHV